MNRTFAVAVPILALASCDVIPSGQARAGYAQIGLCGDLGLASAGSGSSLTANRIDVESELGVGKAGSPYAGAELATGIGRFAVSGFRYEDSGTGTLQAGFGDIPAGSVVDTDMRIDNVKGAWTFDVLDTGVVRLSPGLGVDWFGVDTTVRTVTAISAFERVQVSAPVPMVFLGGEVDLDWVRAIADLGGMKANIGGTDGTFWDLDLRLEASPIHAVAVFVGYRYMAIDANGESDGQRFDADLVLQGWTVGGALRF